MGTKRKASEYIKVIAEALRDLDETPRYVLQYELAIFAAEETMENTRMVLVEKDFTKLIDTE